MKFNEEQIVKHFNSERLNGTGTLAKTAVRDQLQDNMAEFAKELYEIRNGEVELENGLKLGARDISMGELLLEKYGIGVTQNVGGVVKTLPSVKSYLKSLGVYTSSTTINEMLAIGGSSTFSSGSAFEEFLGNPMNTKEIPSDFRFIVREIILEAVRTGYTHKSMVQNWIAATQNLTGSDKVKMPRILTGDTMPAFVAEGADIPYVSLRFGQKEAIVRKIGAAFNITDELLSRSLLDMVFIMLEGVGSDMRIGKDVVGLNTILNGEQIDLSESIPVIGVNTPNSPTLADIDRVITRSDRLDLPIDRIITTETLKNYDFNATFANRERLKIGTYTGLPVDVHAVPAGTIVYLSSQKCLVDLRYESMKMERRRNPQNQTWEMFMTDWVGMAKIRRGAAIEQDTTLQYSNTVDATGGWPSWLDVDARIASGFKPY